MPHGSCKLIATLATDSNNNDFYVFLDRVLFLLLLPKRAGTVVDYAESL